MTRSWYKRHCHPPLQKTQGRGTLFLDWGKKQTKGWATRPVINAARGDVDLLISSGANVNVQGDLGNTPLHHAASRGLLDIAIQLIAAGANRHLENEFGQTPADLATLMRNQELADRLRIK